MKFVIFIPNLYILRGVYVKSGELNVCSASQKDEKRENMKKKIITGLIALAAIVAVAIFVGCIEEDSSPAAKASASPQW